MLFNRQHYPYYFTGGYCHCLDLSRIWLDQKIAIANPKSLTRCTAQQVGEIWVSGSSVACGYWNRPEETEQTFRAYRAWTHHKKKSEVRSQKSEVK